MSFNLSDLFDRIDTLRVAFYRQYVFAVLYFKRKIYKPVKNYQYRKNFYILIFWIGKKISCKKIVSFAARQIYNLKNVGNHILIKYFFRELFLYFLVCFAFFFVVFFVNQILLLAETVLKKRVPLGSVLLLIWYSLPAVIAQSAPFATLVGFLMCLGRLVTDNEFLIFRASGQRYSLILAIVLSAGTAIALFSFIMNDYFLPLGNLKFNKMRNEIIASNPAIELESKSIKRLNDATLILGDVKKNKVSDLVIFDTKEKNKQRVIISKESGVKKSKDDGVLMKLTMNKPLVLSFENSNKLTYDVLESDSMSLNVFEESIMEKKYEIEPREMTSWDLGKEIKKRKKDPNIEKRKLNSYILEYNRKFSMPFGSIFFALLALPLALIFGRKDGLTLGLIFGILISVLYWAASILGQMFGIRSGYNGFWMMWTPNFVLGATGILLYLRLRRK